MRARIPGSPGLGNGSHSEGPRLHRTRPPSLSVKTLRCPTANVWLKVWVVSARIEVLVHHGRVRVILRQERGPAIVEEDELLELQVEETVKGIGEGAR